MSAAVHGRQIELEIGQAPEFDLNKTRKWLRDLTSHYSQSFDSPGSLEPNLTFVGGSFNRVVKFAITLT